MDQPVLLFFNMGPMELLVIMFMVLMFFGAESIPKIARGLGRGIRQVKDAANEIQQDIRDSANEVHKEVEKNSNLLEDNSESKHLDD